MNRLKTLVWLLVGSIAFASCDKTRNEITEPESKVEFTSGVNNLRVENDKWSNGDKVGVFALNAGQTNTTGVYDGKANIMYNAETNGVFTETGTSIIFPKNGSALDFIAYYPYQDEITNGIYNVDITNQSNLSKLDLVYSKDAKGKTKATPKVDLTFNHQLAFFEVKLQVVPGSNILLDNATASFENILTSATFNLFTGALIPGTESTMNLTVNKISDSEARISMILIPDISLDESQLKVVLGGKEYVWKPENISIQAGKKYIVTTSVGAVEGEIQTVFGASITDWTVENINGGTLTPKDSSNNNSGSNTPGGPDNGDSGNQGNGNEQPGGSGSGSGDQGGSSDNIPAPTPGQPELLFESADFENETAFKALLLTQFPLPAYATFADGGRTGKALHIKTGPSTVQKNDFIFNIQGKNKNLAGKKKITFYIKGTAGKSLSIMVYKGESEKPKIFNLKTTTTDKTLSPSSQNGYTGTINTGGNWIKIELDIAAFAGEIAQSGNFFGIKIGEKVAYDLFIDDITVE